MAESKIGAPVTPPVSISQYETGKERTSAINIVELREVSNVLIDDRVETCLTRSGEITWN